MEKLTVLDIKKGKGFLSNELREEFLANRGIKDTDIVVNFAYTDYGGDLFDRIAIEYFKDNKNFIFETTSYFGKNGLLFGDTVIEFLGEFGKYPLGFKDMEDFYFDQQTTAEVDSFNLFLDDLRGYIFNRVDVLEWLMNNKGGYYHMLSSGSLDFCSSELEDELVKNNLITKGDETCN